MNQTQCKSIAKIVKDKLIPLRGATATIEQQEKLHGIVINACEEALKYTDETDAYSVARQFYKEEFENNKKHAKKAAQELAKLSTQYKARVGYEIGLPLFKMIIDKYVEKNDSVSQCLEYFITPSKAINITEDLINSLNQISSEDDHLSLTQQGCIDFGSRTPKDKNVTRDDSLVDMTGRGMSRDYQRHSLAFNLRLIIEKWRDVSCVDFSAQEYDQLSDENFIGNTVLCDIATILLPDTEEDVVKNISRGPEHYKDMFSKLRKQYPRASFTPYVWMAKEPKNKKKFWFSDYRH